MARLVDPTDFSDTTNTVPSSGPAAPTGESAGNLLTLPESEVVATISREWDASRKVVRNWMEQWRVNRARRMGYVGVRLVKIQNENRAYFPLGATPSAKAMNKAARLCRRLRATVFADPPLPEATPATDADEDRDSAEFTTRLLHDLSSEGGLDYVMKAGDAFDLASDYGSGFVRYFVHPTAGGRRPKTLLASAKAQTIQDALIDPQTGTVWPDEPILRYVRTDGTLSDDRTDPKLDYEWLPALRDEILTGKHVRLIPSTARDLWEADAVLVGAMVPLATVKQMFPEMFRGMTDDEVERLVGNRPADVKDLLPTGRKDPASGDAAGDRLLFVLSRYQRQTADYPKGAYCIVVGTEKLAHRGPWHDEAHDQPLDIPLTQFKQYSEEDNPYGTGVMTFLGPGNEIRAEAFETMLEHQERFRRRKTFVPVTSNLKPEQLQAPTATYLPIVPGGEPKFEDVPDFPRATVDMLDRMNADLDDESGLQQIGQGMSTPAVQSGLHAQTIVEQVNVGLSELTQNATRGLVRGWRIMAQLVRAYYTTPQRIQWVGEDGAYKEREWTGEDLGGTKDIRLVKGSFTQLAPSAKAALAQGYAQNQIITAEELRHIITGNVGGLLGLQDDPHRLRVRRQISRWLEGPPEGWSPPPSQTDPTTGQPTQPADPVLVGIFQPLECDEEPDVATVRLYELGRAMASARFVGFDQVWQSGLRGEYLRMRQAAGVQTQAEASQAQQQASQAQQQQEQQKIGAQLEMSKMRTQTQLAQSQGQLALQREKLAAAQGRTVTGPTPEGL